MKKPQIRTIAKNKEVFYNYIITEKFEAGIQLLGAEVKAIRSGRLSLVGGYVSIKNNEAYVVGMHITHHEKSAGKYDPARTRKLLLQKKQIRYLKQKTSQKGVSVVPLRLYTKGNLIKLEIGLGKGKRKYDKRRVLKQREDKRRLARETSEKFLE